MDFWIKLILWFGIAVIIFTVVTNFSGLKNNTADALISGGKGLVGAVVDFVSDPVKDSSESAQSILPGVAETDLNPAAPNQDTSAGSFSHVYGKIPCSSDEQCVSSFSCGSCVCDLLDGNCKS